MNENFNWCGLSDNFIEKSKIFGSADKELPLKYRVLFRLMYDGDYKKVREILEANKDEFNDKYSFEVLDSAVEHCFDDIRIDENNRKYVAPLPEAVDFIRYLLENGANPRLPKEFNQFEHLLDSEGDIAQQNNCIVECDELKQLIEKYM